MEGFYECPDCKKTQLNIPLVKDENGSLECAMCDSLYESKNGILQTLKKNHAS